MKKIQLLIGLLIGCMYAALGQSFSWVNHEPIKYTSNPSYPDYCLVIDTGGRAITSHIDSNSVIYGQNLFGKYSIRCNAADATLIWTYELGLKSCVTRIASDKLGNTYVAGLYMSTLNLNGTDSLVNTGSGFNTNIFLLKLDANGVLLWKKNLTLTHSSISTITAISCDPQNNCWLGYSDFFDGTLLQVDEQGNDLHTLIISGAKIIGGISIDLLGNIYVSGAAENGAFSLGNLNYTVTHNYAMFVARYNAALQASWAYFAHDITFQSPEITADAWGNAYVGGQLLVDSSSFGSVQLHAPQWSTDLFVVKVDSSGNFIWGQQTPLSPSISGKLTRGGNTFIKAAPTGGVYVACNILGIVNFVNGLSLTAGSGGITENRNCILYFDGNGVAQWSIIGGTNSLNAIQSLDIDLAGNIFFTSNINGIGNFDTIAVTTSGAQHFLLAKVEPPLISTISEHNLKPLHALYPNPVTDQIIVPNFQLPTKYSIHEVTGKCIEQGEFHGENNLVVEYLPPGIYLLQIQSGSTVHYYKFSKQNP
jgi:hypothetical protein